MPATVVLGIHRWQRGWAGVLLGASASPTALVDPSLERLVARAPEASCIGIGVPIGLPTTTTRVADVLARRRIGARRVSLPFAPARPVLHAGSYEDASALASTLTGRAISRRVWALRDTIAQVEALAAHDHRLVEVHPEVSFRALHGAELAAKTTWAGQALRRRLLADAGILLPDRLAEGGEVPPADVLDAAAAAWSASRYAAREARSLPYGAVRGQREVIWY